MCRRAGHTYPQLGFENDHHEFIMTLGSDSPWAAACGGAHQALPIAARSTGRTHWLAADSAMGSLLGRADVRGGGRC
jgi:hypothetical protein